MNLAIILVQRVVALQHLTFGPRDSMGVDVMENAGMDVFALAADLDAAARRRLWFLTRVIDTCGLQDVAAALTRAEQLESYVINGRNIAACQSSSTAQPINGRTISSVPPADRKAPYNGHSETARADAKIQPVPRASGLLDTAARERFVEAAARNPDNRHLAALFGLTVRQAHAVRVAFRKLITARTATAEGPIRSASPSGPVVQNTPSPARAERKETHETARAGNRPEPRPAAPSPHSTTRHNAAPHRRPHQPAIKVERVASYRSGPPSGHHGKGMPPAELDRELELRLEEEFLAAKQPTAQSMDDVVRFLRQQGDIVVSAPGGYKVNYSQTLATADLVARANSRRRARGLPPFVVAQEPAPKADNAGAAA